MISPSLLNYIVEFLIGEVYTESELGVKRPHTLITYTDDPEEMKNAQVVVKPSGFFKTKVYGTAAAEPKLPLAEWQGIPLLFGEPRHEWINEGETLLLHADVIASTYYLISRYEEMTHRGDRDKLGRFPGKSSLPYRAGFIHRAVVDEYGEALRRLLSEQGILEQHGLCLSPCKKGFHRINLSHNIHSPSKYRGLQAWWQRLRREQDPYNSFSNIFDLNHNFAQQCPQWQTYTQLFIKVASRHPLDKPRYSLWSKNLTYILKRSERMGAKLGLLCSYASSSNPHLIPEEMKILRKELKRVYKHLYGWQEYRRVSHHQQQTRACHRDLDLISSRHAYLALAEPEDTREMLAAGIRHDYSMGYTDVVGFRLGTCRPVRFINPNTRSLTDLMMHPLSLMDSALAEDERTKHSQEKALRYASNIISTIYRYGGELNMLWDNRSFSQVEHPWLGKLYKQLLMEILLAGQ